MNPEVQSNYIDHIPQIGTVQWIGLRLHKRAPVAIVNSVEVSERALEGDFFRGAIGAPRAVTLIQAEHLAVIASILSRERIAPELLRRNLVVAGINLLYLKQKKFRIGSAILLGTVNCDPCSFMEQQLGPGGYNAMLGHGGITASIVQPGCIRIRDPVQILGQEADRSSPLMLDP